MPSNKIPGSSSRRVPGSRSSFPSPARIGGLLTNVGTRGSSESFAQAHRGQVRDARGHFAGGWGFAWVGLESVADNVIEWRDAEMQNLHQAVESLATEMEAYMKANAPWQDRTGDARDGLQAVVVWNSETNFTIYLGHGAHIDYGIWLEVRWGGRYAIVTPTAEYYGPQIGARLKGMK